MTLTEEIEQEDDGRWIAEALELPGVLAYGQSPEEATAKVQALALRVVADRLEALRGNLWGFYSIRINNQWHIVFRWQPSQAHDVRIVDYH
jgi:predicted RNase H-like HicB family nuclease